MFPFLPFPCLDEEQRSKKPKIESVDDKPVQEEEEEVEEEEEAEELPEVRNFS